jgi:hypothetical protein
MEQFGLYVASSDPLLGVFLDAFRRTYEPCEEPLPPKLEEVVNRLAEVTERAGETTQFRPPRA